MPGFLGIFSRFSGILSRLLGILPAFSQIFPGFSTNQNFWSTLSSPAPPPPTPLLLEDFNAHPENDAVVWKGVIGEHNDADVNDNKKFLLQLCCNSALCIMNEHFIPTQRFAQVHLEQRILKGFLNPVMPRTHKGYI